MNPTIRRCTGDDLSTLRALSIRTYREAFAHLNTPENMRAYLASAFDEERLRRELADPDSDFYFLSIDEGEPAGYLRLNEAPAQTDLHDPRTLELQRIYVDPGHQSAGLGALLMQKAVDEARARGKAALWLGVWEENTRAIAFYQRHGFCEAGRHPFVLGDEVQNDLLLRREL